MNAIRPRLGVNVDHVATVRQARGGVYPDPVAAASLAELAGADQITVHLREDRRHINDRDVRILRETVKTRLNLEMAATEEMLAIAIKTKPDLITLVPEKREEQTTEGGLDVASNVLELTEYVKRLRQSGAHVSMFIDPDSAQVDASKSVGAEYVEFHTGEYCIGSEKFDSVDAYEREIDAQFDRLEIACSEAGAIGIRVAAGHGLNYTNTARVASIPEIEEFNIGHSIVSRAVLVGFERAVREMIAILNQGRYQSNVPRHS